MTAVEIPETPRLESTLLTAETKREYVPEFLAYLLLILAFGMTGGIAGGFAGLATALVWYKVGNPFAFAVGHLLLIIIFPNGIALSTFVLVESAFLAVLIGSLVRARFRVLPILSSSLCTLLLLGLSWFIIQRYSLWLATVLCTGIISLCLYTIHRHGLITLGLVSAERDDKRVETTETATQSTHE